MKNEFEIIKKDLDDELKLKLNEKDAKIYSSQGQQRLIIIAYKIAELLVFKKKKKDYPVLLLDDVFSEIDIRRRNNIVKYLKNQIQVIITTTDLEDIDEDLVNNAKIFGDNGTGVFYDFIKDFQTEYRLEINPITFQQGEKPEGIAFNAGNKVSKNDTVFYEDHYVIIGKNDTIVTSINTLLSNKIGVITSSS